MKLCIVIEMILCCILIVGCTETIREENMDKSLFNEELVNTINDIAMQNAIISQHTLFPYHFVKNSDKLNELGRFDLTILANHFMENPGHLNIRRNNTPEELYQARVSCILEQLEDMGIEAEQITVSDGMPGGSGMGSEKVLTILERENKKTTGRISGGTSRSGVR